MKFSVLARSLTVASALGIAALSANAIAPLDNASVTAEATGRYFIYFNEPGVYHYQGGIDGLVRTANPPNTKFDAGRAEVVQYRAFLAQQQESQIAALQGALGRSLDVTYRYDILFSGIVAENLRASDVTLLQSQPGVSRIEPVLDYELATDRGPSFIGADTIWDGSNTPDGNEYRGNGIVIGVFDTGVNATHPSFANDASCGFDPANNLKLLAAKDCLGSATCASANPVDTNGHGSHTAATAGGNTHIATGGALAGFEVSGVAPCAQLITYKVCPANTCDGAAIAAAIATSIVDQVDVVNFSISGGSSPWADNDRGFLDMVDAGIFVAASAGNTSATITNPIGQVNHRGPWVMTVANSTHDRISKNDVSVAGGPQNVYGLKSDATFSADISAQIADSVALGNPLGCTADGGFAAGSMTGKIALISRGTCTFEEKINNAVGAGAIAVLVHNNNAGPPILMGLGTATARPSLMIPQTEGLAISAFVGTNPTAIATIDSEVVVSLDPIAGDVLNTGSLRGPIGGNIEVTKPDITGPGTNIFAAVAGGPTSYNFLSGTSMSSPHIAGGAALVRGLQPEWTVQEVKSAIQLTAWKDGLKDFTNGTPNNGPWDADDVGNGRIDMTKAAKAGLVLHETTANFLAANANQANQRALNIPSMRHMTCSPDCTWTRTVRNTQSGPSDWSVAGASGNPNLAISVSPETFSFTGDLEETQEITITATPTGNLTAAVAFGEVVFTQAPDADSIFCAGFEDGKSTPCVEVSPELHMTVAIRGTGAP